MSEVQINKENLHLPAGRALVFTIAFNGYQFIYRKHIETHKSYAMKFGFDYVAVDKPALTSLLMECCWLKLVLMLSAFEAGYEWVFFIDADAEIKDICPDFRLLEKPQKSLYMANGFSGRVNSGVIIAKNNPEIHSFLHQTLREFGKKIPSEDAVGWGENGHMIHFSKNRPLLEVIPPLWNNNHTPSLTDYVRHHSAGPMRRLQQTDMISKIVGHVSRRLQRALQNSGMYRYSAKDFPRRLMSLYRSCIKHNSQIFSLIPESEIFSLQNVTQWKNRVQ